MRPYLYIIISAFLLSSCSFIDEQFENCPFDNSGEAIKLSFQMVTSGSVTRTDGFHKEEDSEFNQLEDGIDFSDFGMFVFARLASDTESDEKLILKNTNLLSPSNKDIHIVGSPGEYTVSMTILRTQLHDILFGKESEEEIDPNGTEMISFRVLILANSTTSMGGKEGDWNSITGITFSEVINQLDEWHYSMDNLYDKSYTGQDIEGLYSNTKKNIPMFGTNVFQTSQEALFYSRPEDRVYLGEIALLRALAKVRVVDNIQNKNDDGFPKIIKVEFVGSQNEARQLPNDASQYINGNQVHTPNLYVPDKILNMESAFTYRLGEMPDEMTSISPENRKGLVLVGFVPEQSIGYINNNVGASGMPGFRITVEYFENETKVFEVPMTEYKGQKFEFGENILRNHIYTLSVEQADADFTLKATVTLEPYISIKLDPVFGDPQPWPGKETEN